MNTILFPVVSRIPDTEIPRPPCRFPEAPLASIHRCEARTRILHADDDRSILRASQILLGRAGYDVDTVADGEEAWGALQSVHYHLLITDHHMPRLTGAALIRRIRDSLRPLPIVLASASGLEPEHEGCDAVLPKPFTIRDMIETVRRVLLSPHWPESRAIPQAFLGNGIPG
jgi:CheY-like chemotaxis protein